MTAISNDEENRCLNCPNPVGPEVLFCSEKCEKEWEVEEFERKQAKKAKKRRNKKIVSLAVAGSILVISILLGLYFIPLYETGILRQQENYPKTYQVDNNCSVSYDIKNVNGSAMIFPMKMTCDTKPNQTEDDALVGKINDIHDKLMEDLLQKHPELKNK